MISCSSAPLGPIFSLLTLVAVNQKRDQDAFCNEIREDSKEKREARPDLIGLKASDVLKSLPETFKDVVDTHLVSLHSS